MELILVLILIVFVGGLYTYNKWQVKKSEASFPPSGSFVTIGNYKLHYISEGTGDPIVFLHGGILSSKDFKDVVQLAGKQGYHAIAFDRPGYGYSDRPKHKEVNPMFQAELIHKALGKLGVDKPIILVGHSWSGTMTLSYALQFPNEVAGIVTLGAVMYKEGYPAEHGDILSKITTMPLLGDFILSTLLKTPLGKGMADSMVRSTFEPERAPEEYKRRSICYRFSTKSF
ncbi:alpha/beta fold hydrolase [Radiobacillus deserti]|uniref:alpha/beta fold hydrolase n=1 Tax=Radiobacillus deserti TaxID=2594883 RepID=UPI001E527488|nr:alpha/beta fold hydrolase [Radiobacillus deserti]